MRISFIIILCLILLSCSNTDSSKLIPEIFQTNYSKYKNRKLDLAFGDIVQVNHSLYKGIICDLSEDESGLWYGILFMKNDSLYGRSIPGGFSNGCVKLFDITYLNYTGLSCVTKISKVNLDFDQIGIGSRSTAKNENDLTRDYLRGIERRKIKETPCEQKTKMQEPINENYRSLAEISIDKKM